MTLLEFETFCRERLLTTEYYDTPINASICDIQDFIEQRSGLFFKVKNNDLDEDVERLKE